MGGSSPIHSPTLQGRQSYSDPILESTSNNPLKFDQSEIQYSSAFTSSPVLVSHTGTAHPVRVPPASYHLLNQDMSLRSSEQRWSNISPQSAHSSIPSPTYPGRPKWMEDEMDQHPARMSASGSSVYQQSPVTMRERASHRYYPYPPATTPHAQAHASDHDTPGTSPSSAYPPQGPNSGIFQHPPS